MWKCLPLSLVAVTAILAAANVARAQNFYFGVQGGLNVAHDGEFDNSGADMTFDAGYAYGATLGYETGKQFRLEGELTYRGNHIDSVAGVRQGGKISSTAVMANVFYDFATRGSWAPYLGGGLGTARVTLERAGSDSDRVLAYQLIGGLGYSVSPNTVVTFDYRYFAVNTPTFNAATSFDQEYGNSTLMVGIRARF